MNGRRVTAFRLCLKRIGLSATLVLRIQPESKEHDARPCILEQQSCILQMYISALDERFAFRLAV
jgi:hypothetical protein